MKKPMKRSCMYGGGPTISVANLTAGYTAFRDSLKGGATSLTLTAPWDSSDLKTLLEAIKAAAATSAVPLTGNAIDGKNEVDAALIYIGTSSGTAELNAANFFQLITQLTLTKIGTDSATSTDVVVDQKTIEDAFGKVPAVTPVGSLPSSGGPGSGASSAPAAATSVTYVTPNAPVYINTNSSMKIDFKVGGNTYKGTIPDFSTQTITPVSRTGIVSSVVSTKIGTMNDKAKEIVEQLKNIVPDTYKPTYKPVSITSSLPFTAQAFVDALAQVLYDCAVLNAVNKSMQENVTVKGTAITIDKKSLLKESDITPNPPTAVNFDKDVKVLDALKAALLKLQAKSLTDLAEMIVDLTAKAGGKSKDSKHRRFKGGFQDIDISKMYNAQGLVTELDAALSQHLITNANSIPGPFSAGGLTQSSEGIDANLGDSIRADVVPSYNGGSKKNKSSRRK